MSDKPASTFDNLPPQVGKALNALCDRFEADWSGSGRPRIEDYLGANPHEEYTPVLLRELMLLEIHYRRQLEEVCQLDEYAARFPNLEKAWLAQAVRPEEFAETSGNSIENRTPETSLDGSRGLPSQAPARYQVQKILGEGGFGIVYLAYDEHLQRLVAVKVQNPKLVSGPEDTEAYLVEARTVANLDHPNIVPVYDVGSTEDWPCFIVSKYIDGTDLAARLKNARPSLHEAVELVATVAEALHHAHQQGLVHRDVKPGNILLDKSGKPFVGDFGLALREQDVGKGPCFAGTPAYMSPEQARGEGHRVDSRSDIFSLGVVFYELLTGRRPFKADSQDELLDQIASVDFRPPRQIDDHIPKEVERICLKALSKRSFERYTTSSDMADDLRHFLGTAAGDGWQAVGREDWASAPIVPPTPASATTPHSPPSTPKIVPKGIRSFDATDADFFLKMLPGPRDRDGLTDSIRFWKTRIETADADSTFAVGLIYGPSGCGKSSLVKAGLLPRLAKAVSAAYVEATADETEARLLKALRRQVPGLPSKFSLIESLGALRRGRFLEPRQKVLLVLDQFEQWLHARRNDENTELVQALRQCDGGRLQCIVMVRDDFWLAVSRFMHALEIRIMEGENARLVDLFDLLHARKVLAAFGRAYGRLPDSLGQITKKQHTFLDQAVAGLAQDGKIISVRLALFAEMVKGKPWTPATLKEVGGTEGVGVTFLEETFTASTAAPQHRQHQKAAQAVLKALLPESGIDIKGHMRSQRELLEASGYAGRPKDFEELVLILDSEIRLITPTDPEGKDEGGRMKDESEQSGSSFSIHPSSFRYYQLTHDYLVHSLRDWLTRKQKETRGGRAELLLADHAAMWNARRESRQLPSLVPWLQIKWLTAKNNWTPPQRKMMRKAGRRHALRVLLVSVVLALLGWGGYETHGTLKAYALRDRLLDANTADVPIIVRDMESYRPWVDPLLRDAYTESKAGKYARKQLHASLALLPTDSTQVDYVYDRLLDAQPPEVTVIRDALEPHKEALLDKLWLVVESPEKGKEPQRLRAAAALALYDPKSTRWNQATRKVVNDLLASNPVFLGVWGEVFRPVKTQFFSRLLAVFRDRQPDLVVERTTAADLLTQYAADQPQFLADLLMDADDKQFAVIYPTFKETGEQGLALLGSEISKKLLPVETDWTVRFYQWEKVGQNKPPADWKGVLISPILDELRVPCLSFLSTTELPTNPTNKVPGNYFAVVAKTEVTLGEDEYVLSVTFVDGVRVWFDNKVVFDHWQAGGPGTTKIAIEKQPGRHTIQVDNFRIVGPNALMVELNVDQDTKEKLAKRQVNAAVTLLRMNQPEMVWPLLKHSPDPIVRSYLIDRLGPLGSDAGAVIKRLDAEPDITIRRALILSLGSFDESQLSLSERPPLITKLLALYELESDAGLHSAAEWLLRQWGQEAKLKQLDDRLRTNERGLYASLTTYLNESRRWYINGQGQTMMVVANADDFWMGEKWERHKRRIGRTFAIASKEVTVEQFLRFRKDHEYLKEFAPTAACPVNRVTWYDAAAYCNWLSEQEGIPEEQWCYVPNEAGQYAGGMKMALNHTQRTGYRLPTEAEWEFACRAGAETGYSFGEAEDLIGKYAWYGSNSLSKSHPVGLLKPNDFGLWDMHGNVWEWTQNAYQEYPISGAGQRIEDKEDKQGNINGNSARVLHGGAFDELAAVVRSAFRSSDGAMSRWKHSYGFRPARTLLLRTR